MAEARRLTQLAREVIKAVSLPAGPLVVALSGGADSAALLWTCLRLDRSVRAVHVHHGLPGSEQMKKAAEDIAIRLSVDLVVTNVEVPVGPSPEAQARSVRYAALEGSLEDPEWLLTAHTADDQAETMVDRLLRSSGPQGLAGIPPRRGRIHRPFLDITRAQTRELATLAGLPWADDPANADPDPLRNRIRTRLIPELEAAYNPRLRRALANTARLVAAESDHLAGLAAVPVVEEPGRVVMAAAFITTAPAPIAARRVRLLLEAAGHPSPSPSTVAEVLAVAQGRQRAFQLGEGVEVTRRGALLAVTIPWRGPEACSLSVPGTTTFGTWQLDAALEKESPPALPLGPGWMVADFADVEDLTVEPVAAHADAVRLLGPTGDPRHHPLVLSAGVPLWIPGVHRFPLGWVDSDTHRYLVLRTRPHRTCHRSER